MKKIVSLVLALVLCCCMMTVAFAAEPATKTITVGDKSFTAAEGKWLYNTEWTKGDTAKYSMIIVDKAFTGTVETNGYGIAIVINAEGKLSEIFDGAWNRYYDLSGRVMGTAVDANLYAANAWAELAEGETLVIFPNDGVNAADGGRAFAKSLADNSMTNQAASIEGIGEPETPDVPEHGDNTAIFAMMAMMVISAGAVLVVSKKRAF